MEIGEIGQLGHRVHERVELLYKNHSDSVIIQDRRMVVDIVRVNQHEYDRVKIIQ
jgi:hypothetical protein